MDGAEISLYHVVCGACCICVYHNGDSNTGLSELFLVMVQPVLEHESYSVELIRCKKKFCLELISLEFITMNCTEDGLSSTSLRPGSGVSV